MARPSNIDIFLRTVRESGGRIGNGPLQRALGWADDRYWDVHKRLFESGEIEKGRGYGGSVILADKLPADVPAIEAAVAPPVLEAAVAAQAPAPALEPEIEPTVKMELELYPAARAQLGEHWSKQRQLDDCHCEVVALQGRRDTGGSWSRPDIAIIGHRKYEFLPERIFELHTFEVKAAYDISIKGVMEALAHREAATRSYVLYYTAGKDLDDFPEYSRITDLASRHGVGVFAARAIEDFNQWEEVVPAVRAAPDPEAVDTFIRRSLSDAAKVKIRKWF